MEELIKEIRKLLEVKEKELIDFQSGIKRVSDIDIHNMDRLEELIKILEVNMTDRERIIEKLKEFEVLAYLKENSEKNKKLDNPTFLAVLTGGKYAYTRPDGVKVIPIGCLK